MNVSSKEISNCLVVYIAGKIDIHNTDELESGLKKALESKSKYVVLNLVDLEYISSFGLRAIISLLRAIEKDNRTMKVCNLTPSVRKIFEIVEILDVFDLYASEDEALEAMKASA